MLIVHAISHLTFLHHKMSSLFEGSYYASAGIHPGLSEARWQGRQAAEHTRDSGYCRQGRTKHSGPCTARQRAGQGRAGRSRGDKGKGKAAVARKGKQQAESSGAAVGADEPAATQAAAADQVCVAGCCLIVHGLAAAPQDSSQCRSIPVL